MKKLLLISAVVLFVAITAILLVTLRPSGVPEIAMPDPNGYETLIEAANVLRVSESGKSPDDLNDDELDAYVEINKEALALVDIALEQESRVTLVYDLSLPHLSSFTDFRRLARVLEIRGELAARRGDFVSAAEDYLRVIKLGDHVWRGGLIIDRAISIAFESIGIKRLNQLADELPPAECREVVQALKAIISQSKTTEQTIANQRAWARKSYTMPKTLFFDVWRHFPNSMQNIAEADLRQKVMRNAGDLESCIATFEKRVAEPNVSDQHP